MAESQESPSRGKSGAAARVAAQRAAKAARKAAQRPPAEPIVTEDEIAESVEAASSWLDENQRLLWGGFAALLIGGALVLGITSTQDKAAREAGESLVEAEKTAIAPVIPVVEGVDAEAAADQETYPTLNARAQQALSNFRATLEKHGDTPAGQWAKLGEANSLLELGQFAEALEAYKAVKADGVDAAFLQYRALEGQGLALEGQEKFAEAGEAFEESAKVADGLYKSGADLNVARMLEAQGKVDEAIARLKALVDAEREREPDSGLDASYESELAEQRLARLGAPVEKAAGGMSADIMEQIRRQLGDKVKVLEGGAEGAKGE